MKENYTTPQQTANNKANQQADDERLYEQAVNFVLEQHEASISQMQRHLCISYNIAARLVQRMEEQGIVIRENGVLVPAIATNNATDEYIDEYNLGEKDKWIKVIWQWADKFRISEHSIPRNKTALIAMDNLRIVGYPITYFPDELAYLTQLKIIDICSANLQQVSDWKFLKEMTQLSILKLQNNNLTKIASEIGSLTQLQQLDISQNKLEVFPPEILTLTQLQTLNISHNKLTVIATEISALKQLHTLNISKNLLHTFPLEVFTLKKLKKINFFGNNFFNPPFEIRVFLYMEAQNWRGKWAVGLFDDKGKKESQQKLKEWLVQNPLPPAIDRLKAGGCDVEI